MPRPLPTIAQLRRAFASGATTPVALLDELAARIAADDPHLGAYLSLDMETARHEAAAADLSLPLGGIPVAIKDNINVAGQPCTCGSRILAGHYRAPYDATVIGNLRAAGAIPFGRTNLDEFAMGSATENSGLATTRNPHDPERIPGGSSGGSAAAVAAGLAVAALGSDTGGSIRQPASHCGVVGLKPSYGRVSRYGLVAYASSLDQVGPLTRSVEDAALVLQAIAGPDPRDATCLDLPPPDCLGPLDRGVAGMKLGLPREFFGAGIDPAVRAAVRAAADRLAAAGAELLDVSLPHTDYAVATYYIIAPAEASSNLSRFDGIRYGLRAPHPADIQDLHRRSRELGFGPEVKRRILLGTCVLSAGYHDACYHRAQQVRTLIRRDFERAFQQVDALLTPVAPTPARRLGANTDPLTEYLSDVFTLSANLAGICGISVPAGHADSDGGSRLPVGLQILGPPLAEPTILRVARTAELTTP